MIPRPLTDPGTVRTAIWLLAGGAGIMPFMLAGVVVRVGAGLDAGGALGVVDPVMFAMTIPVVFVVGVVFRVREPSVYLVRHLLSAPVEDFRPRRTAARRVRDAAWFTFHLGLGALVSGVALALLPFVAALLASPFFTVAPLELLFGVDRPTWWGPPIGLACLVALVVGVWSVGPAVRRLAPIVLGPSASEQLAVSRRRAADLAGRNRLARELHDSIGHALSVVTVQSAAAVRVLDTDPEFARTALTAVESTARRALVDLDEVLGVLRAGDDAERSPARTVADLPELIDACGLDVDAVIDVDETAVGASASRETYRIVQETLTNALRHGASPEASVRITTTDVLAVEVSNPTSGRPGSPGRGIAGIRERVALLGGTVHIDVHEGRWRVVAELPLRS